MNDFLKQTEEIKQLQKIADDAKHNLAVSSCSLREHIGDTLKRYCKELKRRSGWDSSSWFHVEDDGITIYCTDYDGDEYDFWMAMEYFTDYDSAMEKYHAEVLRKNEEEKLQKAKEKEEYAKRKEAQELRDYRRLKKKYEG